MIDEDSVPVIVRYGKKNEYCLKSLQAVGPKREIMRSLQRFTVNIPKRLCEELLVNGVLSEPFPGIYVQQDASWYREEFGFDILKYERSVEDLMI